MTVDPLPLFAECPLDQLGSYAESCFFARVFTSRSLVAFQLFKEASPLVSADGGKSFVVVSRHIAPGNVLKLLPSHLRVDVMHQPFAKAGDFATVGDVFEAMRQRDYSLWLVVFQDITSALFIRRWPDDPDIRKIVALNQKSNRPRMKVTGMSFLTRDGPDGEQVPVKTEIHIGSGRRTSRPKPKGRRR
jgi:hypothetical protein